MGKLRFTLTYLLFWVVIVFSCLLAENLALFSNEPMGGMSVDTLILLSLFVVVLLFFYYFKERKENKITIDKILLPIIAIFGTVCIATIWWQGPREFINPDDNYITAISFTIKEKISFSLQVVVWCGVLYGLLFVNNRYSISRNWIRWLSLLYIAGIFIASVIDIIIEFDNIVDIFQGTYTGGGLQFVVYNSNVWAHILLVALLTCIILSTRKFNVVYYILMIHFLAMIILTSCSTATFVGAAALVLYNLYEIGSLFNQQRKKSIALFVVYLSAIAVLIVFFIVMIQTNVSVFENLWTFLDNQILKKDYGTLTSRTTIWDSIFVLLSRNFVDFFFGLGYKTGNAIFTQFYVANYDHSFPIRSTHNGVMEVFLRHGLLGVLLYVDLLAVFIIGAVKLLKKKQRRVAYFYSLCFFALLVHSVAESTLFFTPNLAGVYMTLIFFLPVANVAKEKHFEKLNEELQQQEIVPYKTEKNSVYYFINVVLYGLIIALATSLLIPFLHTNVTPLTVYLIVIGALIIGLFVCPIIATVKDGRKLGDAFRDYIVRPITKNYVAVFSALFVGLMYGFIFRETFTYDLFSTMLYTLFIFAIYEFVFSLFAKPNDCPLYFYFSNQFTKLLRKVSSEVSNG